LCIALTEANKVSVLPNNDSQAIDKAFIELSTSLRIRRPLTASKVCWVCTIATQPKGVSQNRITTEMNLA